MSEMREKPKINLDFSTISKQENGATPRKRTPNETRAFNQYISRMEKGKKNKMILDKC